jgi:hypothetical protein
MQTDVNAKLSEAQHSAQELGRRADKLEVANKRIER